MHLSSLDIDHAHIVLTFPIVHVFATGSLWKAVVDVPCNLQRVVINLERVVDIVVLTVVMYDSRLIWREPVLSHAISALHWWLR